MIITTIPFYRWHHLLFSWMKRWSWLWDQFVFYHKMFKTEWNSGLLLFFPCAWAGGHQLASIKEVLITKFLAIWIYSVFNQSGRHDEPVQRLLSTSFLLYRIFGWVCGDWLRWKSLHVKVILGKILNPTGPWCIQLNMGVCECYIR